ncbi:sugar-binding transcriptional regulator [Anaerofustis stercorihominis]|uniref:Sugar-binding domain protein n=2 Tax=Anaerofustis stercorihominis TaxID=214853 RepID=B1C6R3_9FIRM|nr:sugar-binding transcriptional regulator [Anaerofustis stercorihominis]EDS72700.1 putative sugar-binding domain protein [Anaerofustis stercorihominis DSM 17244]MCQ4794074.1 sugar-binding transcriptional regulator [Anaerofustis stercorihominis]RGD74624.1 sugar-binding transcriptional regulator [Anaerofustis stercorihominis]
MAVEEKILTKIAYYYYKQELTQSEIAQRLHMSRQRVNRLLKKSRELGIVDINIKGYEEYLINLESEIEKKFSLKRVMVAQPQEDEDIFHSLGRAGVELVMDLLEDNLTIGISWGRTIYNTVNYFPVLKGKYKNIKALQLVGSLNNLGDTRLTNDITKNFAEKIDAKAYYMFAPTFVSSKETKDTLMQEESLKKLFSLFNYCDIILGSVGLMANSTSSLKEQQQFLNPRDYSELKEKGAVGNICLNYFDKEGNKIDCDFNNRVMAIDIDSIKRSKNVVCITGGEDKHEAILAALKGKYIDTLVIDKDTADYIMTH